MLYNLLIDWQEVDNGSAYTETFGLASEFFSPTSGVNTYTNSQLIGKTIKALFRENVPFEQVSSNPSDKQFIFDPEFGTLTFDSNEPFNTGEQLFIMWIDSQVTIISDVVTVSEVKNYLRLEGFIDSSESISSEFNDDDALISDLITSARERLEEYTGLSFIPKVYVIEFTNLAGNFEIPFGPITAINYLRDSEGDSISSDNFTLSSNFSKLKYPLYAEMTMEYECGYAVLPKGLKDAMLKEVAYRYINRGDENKEGISREAMVLASKYKTDNWIG